MQLYIDLINAVCHNECAEITTYAYSQKVLPSELHEYEMTRPEFSKVRMHAAIERLKWKNTLSQLSGQCHVK